MTQATDVPHSHEGHLSLPQAPSSPQGSLPTKETATMRRCKHSIARVVRSSSAVHLSPGALQALSPRSCVYTNFVLLDSTSDSREATEIKCDQLYIYIPNLDKSVVSEVKSNWNIILLLSDKEIQRGPITMLDDEIQLKN